MVKLTKIYTKMGDDGTTGLGDGSRVAKTDPRVEAYGAVDEANASIGVVVAEIGRTDRDQGGLGEIAALLTIIQNDLFDVGADLCVPVEPDEASGGRLRVTSGQTERLESEIDKANQHLGTLDSFVLPGGTVVAALLHVARTVTRRAERTCVALLREEGVRVNGETIRYLNRLSDLLFVLSRVANDHGKGDVKWVPGGSR